MTGWPVLALFAAAAVIIALLLLLLDAYRARDSYREQVQVLRRLRLQAEASRGTYSRALPERPAPPAPARRDPEDTGPSPMYSERGGR